MTGCEDAADVYEAFDYFGTGNKEAFGTDTIPEEAFSNEESFLFANYDVKTVKESTNSVLPEYDFSGPVNNGISSSNENNSNVPKVSPDINQKPSSPTIFVMPGHHKTIITPYEASSKDRENELIEKLIKKGFMKKQSKSKNAKALKKILTQYYAKTIKDPIELKILDDAKKNNWIKLCQTDGMSWKEKGSTMREYEANWIVADYLRQYLEKAGYNVIMSRDSKTQIDEDGNTNKKAALVANKAKVDLLVAIHFDGVVNSKSKSGSHIIIANKKDNSTKVAEKCAKSILDSIKSKTKVGVESNSNYKNGILHSPVKGTSSSMPYTLLSWSEVPAMILECGYPGSGNADDFNSNSKKENYAKAVAAGIEKSLPIQ